MKNKDFYNDRDNSNTDNFEKVDVNVMLTDDILKFFKGIEKLTEASQEDDRVCPNCNTSFRDIRANMEVGCEVCYKTFKNEITALLRMRNILPRIQQHDPLTDLKRELEVAIKTENYEKAAELKEKLEGLMNDNTRV